MLYVAIATVRGVNSEKLSGYTRISSTCSPNEAMISPDVLKASFAEALQAIEDVSNYKMQALPKMKETIEMFSDMAENGQKVVEKIETTNKNLIE